MSNIGDQRHSMFNMCETLSPINESPSC